MRSTLLATLCALPLVFASGYAQALVVGEQAPCVVLNNIAHDGTESEHCIRTPNVEGQAKILEFFSATCSDCMENLPILSALATRTDKVATTRMIGIDRKEQLMRDYIKAHSDLINFEVALDPNRDAKRAYDIFATPTTFVLDKNEKVLFRHEGVLTPSDLQTIEKLVGQQ